MGELTWRREEREKLIFLSWVWMKALIVNRTKIKLTTGGRFEEEIFSKARKVRQTDLGSSDSSFIFIRLPPSEKDLKNK